MQDVGGRQPAREIAINADVGGVEHVVHADHRADGRAPLVDRIIGDVRMGVDDARRDVLAGHVDHLRIGRDRHVGADRGDFSVPDDDGAVRDRAFRDRVHRTAAQRDHARLRGLTVHSSRRGQPQCRRDGQDEK